MISKRLVAAAITLIIGMYGCKKDQTAKPAHIDISKLVDKQWYVNGIRDTVNTTSAFFTTFSSDSSGSYSYCSWYVKPYKYAKIDWNWARQGEDTIVIDGYYKLKIRSLNDSVLVTNGLWITTGIVPGEIDSSSVTFKSF